MKQKTKRNSICYLIARNLTDIYIKTYHKIEINEEENIPKTGPGLIIPKHQFMKDILLEGFVLKKYVRKPASWVMKYSLPKCLEKIGAIRFYREKEIRNGLKKIKNINNSSKQSSNKQLL